MGVIDHLDPVRDVVFSNHRCHGHYLAFTDDVDGLLGEVMGRVTGVCGGKGGSQHLCNGNFYSNGVQGSIVPVATGMALAEAGIRRRDRRLPRRRHARSGHGLRVPEHRLALVAADPLRRREQPLRAVDAAPARGRRLDSRPGAPVRHRLPRTSTRPTCSRSTARRGRAIAGVRGDGPPRLPRPRHVPLQPALEGGRHPRPGGDRDTARARSARRCRSAPLAGRARRRARQSVRKRLADGARGGRASAARPGGRRSRRTPT